LGVAAACARGTQKLAAFLELQSKLSRSTDGQVLWDEGEIFIGQKRHLFLEYRENGDTLINELRDDSERRVPHGLENHFPDKEEPMKRALQGNRITPTRPQGYKHVAIEIQPRAAETSRRLASYKVLQFLFEPERPVT
jgi:hypothetical protein